MSSEGLLTDVFIYPIKGLSGQRLERVWVTPERGFPFDRLIALAPRDGAYAPGQDGVPTEEAFSRLYAQVRYARLAGVSTEFHPVTGRLLVSVQGHQVLDCRLTSHEGIDTASRLFANVLDLEPEDRPMLVHAGPTHNFGWPGLSDASMMWACHLVNLASIREFEERIGREVDPRRFRANLHLDLGQPWIERDWIGRSFDVGEVSLEGVLATVRCATTEVNVDTAIRDVPIPRLLMQHDGHTEMGIYANIRTAGEFAPGMPVTVHES